MNTPPIPVILSGGAGTRLWPLSRQNYPKQLLPLCSERTLLQETALRGVRPPLLVCNHEHRFIVAEQLRQIGIEPRALVVEPEPRNTAPAVAVAALMLEAADPGAIMLVMPSDHRVADEAAFRAAVEAAMPLARAGMMVTFGVTPTRPEIGYGYIRPGAPLDAGFTVESFVEKPDAATAERLLASGQYYWNSGIFLFPAARYLDELAARRPAILDGCRQALEQSAADLSFLRLGAAFAAIDGASVDHAVLELAARLAVVPVEMGWSDLGSWAALWREGAADAAGNVLVGDALAVEARDSYVRTDGALVALLGVEDLVVVATADAVLVAAKGRDAELGRLVATLRTDGRREAMEGTRSWRPWGWFETLDRGPRFQVKHLQVEPGARLSLQKHWHRSEHWVVVTGTALVTRGTDTFVLRENESAYIPAGTLHRLENPGRLPLRIIEVQSGDYVGEDDIVRIEDAYGR